MSGVLVEGVEVLPLHSAPHLIEQCCNLLNLEWKRSEVARLRSLECSCAKLPTCLILVRNENNLTEVIGHSKLTRIPSIPQGCFIESVVIHPNFRRRGLGKYLMKCSEDYAKSQGFSVVYLSTHDQQVFYGKLGYNECPPVSIYGSWTPVNQVKESEVLKENSLDTETLTTQSKSRKVVIPTSLPLIPPPPPLPNYHQAAVLKKIFMNKQLS